MELINIYAIIMINFFSIENNKKNISKIVILILIMAVFHIKI